MSEKNKTTSTPVRTPSHRIVFLEKYDTYAGTGPAFLCSTPDMLILAGEGLDAVEIDPDDVIKAALRIQINRRAQPADVESDIEHEALLDQIINHAEATDGSIQVLEGNVESVRPEHFDGTSANSILEAAHFIEANGLQNDRQWSMIWNLYQCMRVAANRSKSVT